MRFGPQLIDNRGVPTAFGQLLKKLLEARGWSQRDLARHANSTSSEVSMASTGARSVQLEKLERWAKALELTGDEYSEFRELGLLSQCPKEIQQKYLEMKRKKPRG